MDAQPLFTQDDIIYTYTRAQAIEDGYLVDVSEVASEAGFRWPVAVTRAVWDMVENIPPSKQGWEDVNGRLWDVIWMARLAAIRGGDLILYKLILTHGRKRYAVLKMTIGAACPTDPSPCITIMLPNED